MIKLKTKDEIRIIGEGGKRLAAILSRLASEVKPGTHTKDLEDMADKLIRQEGGRPAFKNYPMGGDLYFPSTLCVSINDEVVHGASLPDREIKAGDIVDLDIGMEWPVTPELREKYEAPVNPDSQAGGYYTDTCVTVGAGRVSQEAKDLMKIARECLEKGIKQAKPGNTINDIARAIQDHAESHGYGVVRDLVGHGVGHAAHEAPDVFNFEIEEDAPDNVRLEPGMVIAIEPMINEGTWRVKVARNGYTILTADHGLSAHFEHTIAITEKGHEVLTKK